MGTEDCFAFFRTLLDLAEPDEPRHIHPTCTPSGRLSDDASLAAHVWYWTGYPESDTFTVPGGAVVVNLSSNVPRRSRRTGSLSW
jgi:hypothetical protein